MRDDYILLNAIETYGIRSQMMVAVEELAELQKEISKAYRGNFNEQAMIEEMTDVLIMIDQLKLYFQIDDKEINNERIIKIARLQERIKDATTF